MYSVNWDTHVITIPQSDLVDNGGGNYELPLSDFHDECRRLEYAFDEGLSRLQILDFTPAITLSGVTYAAFYVLINNYTVTFEDGLYKVVITGGNSNVFDNTNKNQVSVANTASAGMTQPLSLDDIAQAVWAELTSSYNTGDSFGGSFNIVHILINELHRLQGLDSANPMTVTRTTRHAGNINQQITGDGENTTTVTRV